jgi:hypothetical protein
MGLFTPLQKWLHADRQELTRDDLVQRVVDGIADTRTFGPSGTILLPPGLRITVGLPSDHPGRQLIASMLHQPGFDAEVGRSLANRLPDVSPHELPLRAYAVCEEDAINLKVTAAEGVLPARILIDGGDRNQAAIELASDQRRFHVGRGPWHGPDRSIPNEIIVTRRQNWVSRRAAVIDRNGANWTVSPRDQRECLTLIHPDGRRVRPWMTPRGQALLQDGDRLEFSDGENEEIGLLFLAPELQVSP